jgi:hypothetical protein
VTSYLGSIPLQHLLNSVLVFNCLDDYWSSLTYAYVAYSASLVLSTMLNGLLMQNGASHQVIAPSLPVVHIPCVQHQEVGCARISLRSDD